MKHEAIPAAISDRLNSHRRNVVLALVEARPDKLRNHLLATCDPMTGQPDGGTKSAMLGGACYHCGLSRDAILDLARGEKCDARRARFGAPVIDEDGKE